jgi:hypothetical protein
MGLPKRACQRAATSELTERLDVVPFGQAHGDACLGHAHRDALGGEHVDQNLGGGEGPKSTTVPAQSKITASRC